MSFSGGNRQYVKSNLPSPFGIAIKDDFMYWVDRNLKKVSILMYSSSKLLQIINGMIRVPMLCMKILIHLITKYMHNGEQVTSL